MNHKVQLKHPDGKKAIAMPKERYDLLKPAVLKLLRSRESATFNEISAAIVEDFARRKTVFKGSIPWHLEWVKLDLEARKFIKRVPGTSPQKYEIISQEVAS